MFSGASKAQTKVYCPFESLSLQVLPPLAKVGADELAAFTVTGKLCPQLPVQGGIP